VDNKLNRAVIRWWGIRVHLNNVLFYSPSALVIAIANFGNSASYFEFSSDTLPVRNQQRAFPSFSAEILKVVGARHNILKPAEIEEILGNQDSSKWLIEQNIFHLLRNINLKKKRGNIQSLHYGADPYLAKFTLKTLFSGRKSWMECIKWRKGLKCIPASSLLLCESRNRINRMVGLPIEKVSFEQLEIVALMVSGDEDKQGISFFRTLENQFVVFGVDGGEFDLEENKNIVKEVLKYLDLSKCDILIKPHPNYSEDIGIAVGAITQMLAELEIGRIQVIDKLIPLELLICNIKCLHFFGVPSSALMTYPKDRFTILNVMPSRQELFKRGYLNAEI